MFGGLFIVPGCAAPAYVAGKRAPLKVSPDIKHDEGRLEAKGGVKLLVQSWKPQTAAPRAAIVLVHGLKDHGDQYAELAERLVRKGYTVHALDLRGHGDSEGDRVWVDSFSEYVEDVELFVTKVRADEGDKPIFVFGHSMGGAIVTLYVLDRNPDLKGVILSAPALKPGTNVSGGLIAVTGALGSIAPTLAVLELDNTQFSRDPKEVEAMSTNPLIYDKPGPARTAKELLNALGTIGERMGEFKHPLLIVHGAADTVTNPEGSRELVEKAASKDKELKLYDGAFHNLLHDTDREKVLADIEGWLETRTPAAVAAPGPAAEAAPAGDAAPVAAPTP